MHIEYAKETLENIKKQSVKYEWKESYIKIWLKTLFFEKEFLEFLIENGNELTRNIAMSILPKIGNRYFKLTDKQKEAVLNDISLRFSEDEFLKLIKFNK